MKKTLILSLFIILIVSCKYQENKQSRIIIDKYTRRLNSLIIDISSSRNEEGNQSILTLNNFFDKYISKFEDFNDDLVFETISDKYIPKREKLIFFSRNMCEYLKIRKQAILNMSDVFSTHESLVQREKDYHKYDESRKLASTLSSMHYYFTLGMENLIKISEETYEFNQSKALYLDNLQCIDSLYILIDSIFVNYNESIQNAKLIEKLIIPESFSDTSNDWLLNNEEYIIGLKSRE